VTYGTTYDIYIIYNIYIYIDKFHSKLVYVGLAQARPNYGKRAQLPTFIALAQVRPNKRGLHTMKH